LGVGRNGAVRAGVYTREILVLRVAGFEGTIAGIIGCVEGTSDTVVNVFAVVSGVGAVRVAGFEAEGVGTHEAMGKVD